MSYKKEVFFDILFWIGLSLIAFAFFYNEFFIITLLIGIILAALGLLEDLRLKFLSKKDFIIKNKGLFLSLILIISLLIIIALIQESVKIKTLIWKSSLIKIINNPIEINFSFYLLLGASIGLLLLLILFISVMRLRNNKLVKTIVKNEEQMLSSLKYYIKKALELNHKKRHIRRKTIASGWPRHLFEKAYSEVSKKHAVKIRINKKNRSISLFISILILIASIFYIFYSKGLLLIQDWLKTILKIIKIIPTGGYIAIFSLLLLLFILYFFKKTKKQKHKKSASKNIIIIKAYLAKKRSNETDFDILYNSLQSIKKISLSEIEQGFNISQKKAEEWCKVLEDHKLAILHYPAIGEAELRSIDYIEVKK